MPQKTVRVTGNNPKELEHRAADEACRLVTFKPLTKILCIPGYEVHETDTVDGDTYWADITVSDWDSYSAKRMVARRARK